MTSLPEEVQALLDAEPAGFLGMSDSEGPYVVPISFAREGALLYFHGGQGRKAELLEQHPAVCLAVTSPPVLVKGENPCKDTFHYSSALLFGQVRRLTGEAERGRGLRALARKYHPEAADAPFLEATVARTLVYALEVRKVTVKRHPKN